MVYGGRDVLVAGVFQKVHQVKGKIVVENELVGERYIQIRIGHGAEGFAGFNVVARVAQLAEANVLPDLKIDLAKVETGFEDFFVTQKLFKFAFQRRIRADDGKQLFHEIILAELR